MNTTQNDERLFNGAYLSLFAINLIVSISFYMVSTTISLYVTAFGATAAVAGTVVGALSIASMCVRPFSGIMSDRFSRKRLLTLSLIGISVAMVGCGLTSDIPLLIAFRVLHGLCFSIATTVTMALVAGTIPKRRMTQGLAYFAVGQTITSAFAPSLGIWLGQSFGYTVTFVGAAGLVLLAATLSLWLVRRQTVTRTNIGHKLALSDFIAKEAIPFGLLAIVVAGATGVENGFVALYGQQLGLGNVGWYFTIGAVALFVSRLGSGKLADKHASLVMYAGLGFISVAFVLLGLGTVGNMAVLFAGAAVFKALGLGAVQPTLQASSLKSVSDDRRGAASCTYYLGTDIGQAFAPMLGGVVAVAHGYNTMFLLFALPQLVGIAYYAWLSRKQAAR
jgi:MFS family permease